MNEPLFMITQDEAGNYAYSLMSGSGEALLTLGGYPTAEEVYDAIASVKKNAKKDRRFQRINGVLVFSFALIDADANVIGKSGRYRGTLDRELAVMTVRKVVGIAGIQRKAS